MALLLGALIFARALHHRAPSAASIDRRIDANNALLGKLPPGSPMSDALFDQNVILQQDRNDIVQREPYRR